MFLNKKQFCHLLYKQGNNDFLKLDHCIRKKCSGVILVSTALE